MLEAELGDSLIGFIVDDEIKDKVGVLDMRLGIHCERNLSGCKIWERAITA